MPVALPDSEVPDVHARPASDQRDRPRRAGPGRRQRPAGGSRRSVRRDADDDAVPVPGVQFPRGGGQAVQGPALRRGHRGDRARRADRHHDLPAPRRLPAVQGQGDQAARRARQGRGDPAVDRAGPQQHPPLPGGRPGRAAGRRRREPLVGLLRLQQRQPRARPALQPHARVDRPPAEVPHLRDDRQQDGAGDDLLPDRARPGARERLREGAGEPRASTGARRCRSRRRTPSGSPR